ncbi:glycerophosphodiester phosphodiesterase family protein [uncultured Winogradskyella sp.]|uniref:glycerophosphodiester phosphodiesterase family protein n=1 Tax=uncultured Winogradskyella sp. TaxID=395353 RepID=UPI00261E782E|nr:glycerophosphodiester phosphodiesterase family protein [uncultured Winogradskyella sp.]
MGCNTKTIDIQGHRGCRGLMPENSLPAFEKAIELGVTTLELDIVISKDLKVVVSHEPFINSEICVLDDTLQANTFNSRRYNMFQMTYEAIKAFDCGSKKNLRFLEQKKLKTHKPLLSDVFQLVTAKNSNVKFNIELKTEQEYAYGIYTPHPKAYVNIVLAEIIRCNMLHRVNLQSFDSAVLEEIKVQAPKMEVALLVDENETIKSRLEALSFTPEIISPYYKLLTPTKVKNYKALGFKVIPWTVNTKPDMLKMLDFKVDGIITDYPDRLLQLLLK